MRVVWDDEAFDNTDPASVPLHEGPGDGFDPPWRLDPLQNIVNVNWRTDDHDRWATVAFRVYGRFRVDPDTILIENTFISYWRIGLYPDGPPPYDVEPDNGALAIRTGYSPGSGWGAAGDGTVTGVEALPGETTLGAGNLYEEQLEGDLNRAGLKARYEGNEGPAPESSGGPEIIIPVSPEGEAYTSTTTATFDVYHAHLESAGAILDSFDVGFGSINVEIEGVNFTPIGLSVVHREEGVDQHNPPFTGPPVAQNDIDFGMVWILCERVA